MKLHAPHSLNPSERDVAVFTAIGRLINRWWDDPERLAVAAYAYESVLGYSAAANEAVVGSHDAALEHVAQALHRRNRKVLRARAEGLVLALHALAEDANAWELHQAQLDSCVIECRDLPIEERLARLRGKARSGASEPAAAPAPGTAGADAGELTPRGPSGDPQ